MNLIKPRVFKKCFNSFEDGRGFLSALNINEILSNVDDKFKPIYQLISHTEEKNTFRGFHFQNKPYAQNKLVIVHSGSILDFIVDIKSHKINSVESYELTKGDMIFIPNNYAHGFISKSKNVVLQYIMDDIYSPDHYDGINAINFLDKNFDIESITISDKDKNYLKILE
jgi:dTDP-4-dehydrorhamnose 3,5-epimerase